MQPQVDLNADPVVVAVGVPAEREQILPGASEKFLFAQGDMVFTTGIRRPGNIAMCDQQLRVFPLP